MGLLDSIGALVVEYKYDAWGKKLSTTGTLTYTLGILNPFRYRGYVFDEEMGSQVLDMLVVWLKDFSNPFLKKYFDLWRSNMKKKLFIISIINVMAFGSIMATLYFECGFGTFIKVLLPASIIFGTYFALFSKLLIKD